MNTIMEKDWENINLDYEGENKYASFFSSQGNIHSYPAKAVPEMVRDLIKKVSLISEVQSVLDPFVGSGTMALESKYLGLDFYGSDLNPLAVLLARTKSVTIKNTNYVKRHLNEFTNKINEDYKNTNVVVLNQFNNIEYWFKKNNIRELSYIKNEIIQFLEKSKTYRECYALILLTAFSSTIRKVSLTRNGEFKLYRMSPNDIEKFSINALSVFEDSINDLLSLLVAANDTYKKETKCKIHLKNAKSLDYLNDRSIDLVITSPPYGDSKSTVAYGQFSRLSIQWMSDIMYKYLKIPMEADNCDELLLGGKRSDCELNELFGFTVSKELNELLKNMDLKIKDKKNELDSVKVLLEKIILKSKEGKLIIKEDFKNNNVLYELIEERVRLEIYRKINKKVSNLSNKLIKKLAREQTIIFMKELFDISSRKHFRRQKFVSEKLGDISKTVDRSIKSIIKRKEEIVLFLKDLYKAVIETDRVLKNGGFQVWIVGHRTILGEIVINMVDIIKEWFANMGYSYITSLERKYSFKRMPHHINSTIRRNEKVNTMMNEYILVVQKH